MADDWIKIRTCLVDEEEVSGIHKITGLSIPAVIGSLHIIWSWADGRTTDGFVRFTEKEDIDKRVECSGFCDAMCEVGWLEIKDGGVYFPNFEAHMSKSAKKRASDAKRKLKSRKCPKNVTTKTDKCHNKIGHEADKKCDQRREEKRREELIKEKDKKESSDSQSGDCSPSLPKQEQLDSLIDSWNSLPKDMAPPVVKRDSEPIMSGWKKVQRTPALREAFADIPHLMSKIRDGTFLHRQSWFRFAWLFGKKNGEWNVIKILQGVYVDGGGTKQRSISRVDDADSRDGLRFLRES